MRVSTLWAPQLQSVLDLFSWFLMHVKNQCWVFSAQTRAVLNLSDPKISGIVVPLTCHSQMLIISKAEICLQTVWDPSVPCQGPWLMENLAGQWWGADTAWWRQIYEMQVGIPSLCQKLLLWLDAGKGISFLLNPSSLNAQEKLELRIVCTLLLQLASPSLLCWPGIHHRDWVPPWRLLLFIFPLPSITWSCTNLIFCKSTPSLLHHSTQTEAGRSWPIPTWRGCVLSGHSRFHLGVKGKCPRASLPLLSLEEVLQESNCLPNAVKSSGKMLFLLLWFKRAWQGCGIWWLPGFYPPVRLSTFASLRLEVSLEVFSICCNSG